MRLPLIPPSKLTPEQAALYDDMKASISADYQGFISMCSDGSLTGPWNPWLHWPKVGKAAWELSKQLTATSTLPEECRQIAILVTGAHFKAGYEVYAHVALAQKAAHLDDDVISAIIAGQRPSGLPRKQALAYDAAAALVSGGTMPELPFRLAREAFGADGVAELIFLVGMYSNVSMVLNGFDMGIPAPDRN
jgi:4-carboxymuconolactone decarboxylase